MVSPLIVLALSVVACHSSTGPDGELGDAAIVYNISSSYPILGYSAPAPPRRAGQAFDVIVNTYPGASCSKADRVEVKQVSAMVVTVTPFNRLASSATGPCGGYVIEHTARVTFARAGKALLIIQGRNAGTLKATKIPIEITIAP
ncbi:MAG: hypothetical protein IT353_22795 [Gemmatimonadaceae bacterium]|nr:hypothetical protein [Gemmatimonadaceae bacterium]